MDRLTLKKNNQNEFFSKLDPAAIEQRGRRTMYKASYRTVIRLTPSWLPPFNRRCTILLNRRSRSGPLKVFRDKTSLSANPALWPSIEKALAESQYFPLLASPQAAQSSGIHGGDPYADRRN